MSLIFLLDDDGDSAPGLTAYPLNDDGTVAASFGVGWLETDAPDYTSADYTYTGAATGGQVVATPSAANVFGPQAITVTSSDILSLEAEIISNDATYFNNIGLGAVMSSGGSVAGAIIAFAGQWQWQPIEWGGTGVVLQERTSPIAGFRVGIDIDGTTGTIRIKSSDGVQVSSTTFTPPMQFTAYLHVSDNGAEAAPGDTTSLRLIVPAADYTLPCPVGAKNLLGDTIFSPTNLPGTLDLWKWNDLTRLWTTSELSTPVASVGDPVGAWRGQMDAYTLIQAVANSRYEYAADGVLLNSASNTKSMEAAYSQDATAPFWIARRVITVSNQSARIGMGAPAVDYNPNSVSHKVATAEQRAVVRGATTDSTVIGTGDKCMVVWFDGTLGWMMDDDGAVISCAIGTNAVAIAALRARGIVADNVNARIKYFQIGTTGMTASLAAQWMTWARAQP